MLTKTYLEDHLVRRLKGLDGGALAVLLRTPPMAESDSIPATATFTAPRAGIWAKLTMGDPLGRVHRGRVRWSAAAGVLPPWLPASDSRLIHLAA